jgi:hypothetical protein
MIGKKVPLQAKINGRNCKFKIKASIFSSNILDVIYTKEHLNWRNALKGVNEQIS